MKCPTGWELVFTARNGMEISFRPKLSSDTEMFWEMFSTLSEKSASNLLPPFTRERIEGWTTNIDYDEVLTIVAVIMKNNQQRIIGSASLKFDPNEHSKHKAELGITVHDDYQNLGIGTALVRHLLNIAKKKKLRKIWLQVNTNNNSAIRIYRKVGFQIEGKLCKERFINGKYRDEYRMAILL